MAQIVNMPKLGFDMAEGTLVRWVANEGDKVTKGSVLAEIETDKATVEVESNYDGTLLRQLVQQGAVVPINDPIAVIGEPGEEIPSIEQAAKPGPAEQGKSEENAVEVEAGSAAGEQAAKPTEESAPAEAAPKPIEEGALVVPPSPTPAETAAPVSGGPILASPLASPLAKSMAIQMGIDLRKLKGTGPGGRITKKDIENFQAKGPEVPPAKAVAVTTSPQAAPKLVFIHQTRNIPLPRLRAAIGRRMTESMQQSPHFYVTHEYDVGGLVDRRKELNDLLGEEEKLSVNDFIVRAVALTLLEFPNLNASLDLKNNNLIYHGEINVGVAVAVQNGLLTIVSRNADQKTVHQISSELKGMVTRARDGKVKQEDIEGSTFTVSNLGMFDVDQFTAIINPPEAAILAVGSAKQVPVVVNGEIKIGTRMKATLSVDHRVSDGAEGARFLQALAKYIEEPLRLLL